MTIRQNSFIAGEMISRRQMLEMGMPIGNPHLPPFNRREMPFVVASVTAASVAIGAAGTAIAAGGVMASMAAIGTAALATVSAIGTIAAVAGTAMSVVGMVTGDKSLMKLGAIVGLAGGVASLASGAVASLAAGGEFAMGTAGIQSANAANAAATNTANLAAHGAVTGGLASTSHTALGEFTGQAAREASINTAQMSPVALQGGATSSQIGSALGQNATFLPNSGLIGKTASGAFLSGAEALNAGGSGAALAANSAASSGTFLDKLMGSMTEKDYVITGFSALTGGAKMMEANQASANRQKEYEYRQAVQQNRVNNLNSVPSLRNSLDANTGLNANAGL